MINFKLPQVQNVVAGQSATLKIPRYSLTLQKIQLALSGTFTKAQITDIKVKLGTKLLVNYSGSDLDKMNKYKGIYDDAGFLTLDFTERDSATVTGCEIGGYDLYALCTPNAKNPGGRDLTVEFAISGAATTPGLVATGFFSAMQGTGDGAAVAAGDLITKFLQFPVNGIASRNVIQLDTRGAAIKRLWLFYDGTDGNVNRVMFKKDGTEVFDQTVSEAIFTQREYRKVPQAKVFVVDWIVDNNPNSMLQTDDAKMLEFNAYLTAADGTARVIMEVIDLPDNA
jgi:hypothetical protein